MRRIVLVGVLLIAGAAGAADPDRKTLSDDEPYAWAMDAQVLCNERYSGFLAEECFSTMIRAAETIAMLEQSDGFDLSESDFGIDGDPRNAKLIALTKRCRASTMDGKRVDVASALLCVHYTVRDINGTARREKRLREEAAGNE